MRQVHILDAPVRPLFRSLTRLESTSQGTRVHDLGQRAELPQPHIKYNHFMKIDAQYSPIHLKLKFQNDICGPECGK
jgi:hypothetical protein